MAEGRPSLQDIARRAKMSAMSVSRALRGQPGISRESSRRIRKLAHTMGYRPNPLVQALMEQVRTRRTKQGAHQIALLVPQMNDPQWGQQEWIRRSIQGAKERAQRAGFQMQVMPLQQSRMSAGRMDQILKARGIRGLVIAPLAEPGFALELDWSHYAAAAIGATLSHPRLHRVRHHALHSVQLALDKLGEAGRRRVGLAVSTRAATRVNHLWQAGFFVANDGRTAAERAALLYQPEKYEREGFLAWIRAARPDGLLVPDLASCTWLIESGIKIPDEVALAYLNCPRAPKGLAGIDQRFERVGAAAVDLVIEQYYHGEFGVPVEPKDVLMQGVWMPGWTVPNFGAAKLAPKLAAS